MSETFAALAALFRYPEAPPVIHPHDDARGELDAFAREIAALDRGELQATYTSTFDLAPSCSPYLGAHLFGDEGPGRGRLLIGLRASYEKAGLHFDDGELPDHVSEVLAFAAHDEAEEWPDLVRLILVPALTKMDDLVRASSNPYRHLIAAARQTSEAALRRGGER
jgi:nitrate reductase molybdenum cofactor assembly chaperone